MIWGAPNFCPKNDMMQKSIGFSVQIEVFSKKKFISYFSVAFQKKENKRERGGLGRHSEHFRRAKLPKTYEIAKKYEIAQNFGAKLPKKFEMPKILTQYRPKNMKLPEILTPQTKLGVQCPPGPPPPTPLRSIIKSTSKNV